MENWLAAQSEKVVLSWESSMARFYPQYVEMWSSPVAHLQALTQQWNTLTASQSVHWDQYLVGSDLKLLDLGAGTGWLSILLSKRENIGQIYALDASPNNLGAMLPGLAALMGGDLAKITPVLGLFTPLLVDDGSFDVVVASAAIHHAPDLAECLQEIYRVLKPGGVCLILNELPLPAWYYAAVVVSRCARILASVALRQWRPLASSISENGLMMDPGLGDRAYGGWQWKAAIEAAGFSYKRLATPYYSYQHSGQRQLLRLTHFVARRP